MIKGFAYIAWQIENHPMAEARAVTDRYIAQEATRLLSPSSILHPPSCS